MTTPAGEPSEVTGKIDFSAPDTTINPQNQLFVMNADGIGHILQFNIRVDHSLGCS